MERTEPKPNRARTNQEREAGSAGRRFLRGQVYMVETITVLIVSMIILVTSFSILSGINSYRAATDRTMNAVEDATDSLMLSRGYPPDWDQNAPQASVLGIALRRNVIDSAKLNSLNLTDFSALMGLERFNVSVSIYSGGIQVYQVGSVNSSTSITLIERTCAFSNGTPCTLRVQASGGA